MLILVTGGAGFVGLNLLEALLGRGESVVVFDTKPLPAAALHDFASLPGRLHVVSGDVRDRDAIVRAMAAHAVDRLIHAAAVTAGSERDAADPGGIAEINLVGTIRALEAARERGLRRVVHVGTGAVYGDLGIVPDNQLDEVRDLPRPVGMYPITKYAAERACLRLSALWGMDIVVGRLAMVFGRWEYESGARDRMALPLQTVRLAIRGEEARILRVEEQRDWIYGADVAAGLVALLDAPKLASQVFHVGTGMPWDIRDWCERLVATYPGFRYRFVTDPAAANVLPLGAVGRSPFRVDRIRSEAGFTPRYPLDRAFQDYTAWLRSHDAFG
jgi:nucleoside-diphosphate-sugar epimerase